MKKAVFVMWLVFFAAFTRAEIYFDDGGEHIIDYEISGNVYVENSAAGSVTSLTLTSGGKIGYTLLGYDDSQITVLDGEIGNGVYAYDNCQATVSGGYLEYFVSAQGNSVVNIQGGNIRSVYAWHDSHVTVSGGEFGHGMENYGWLDVNHESQVSITGGNFQGFLRVIHDSTATMSGGHFEDHFFLAGNGELTIFGTNFNYPYGLLPASGTLTGLLANGDILNNDFRIYENANIILTSVPGPINSPPVADAGGPYIINVGDTLTLDASGSTDDHNDITSYVWDLDDDGTFETDAVGQAVFSVDYAHLDSLGLIAGGPYDIHVQVTDTEQQSDTDTSTLTIAPPPVIEAVVDIKPGSCPNPLNVKSRGVVPVAILGSAYLDVTTIDAGSIFLNGARNVRSGYEDVAGFIADANDCECTALGPDGYLDLTLKFMTQDIVATFGEVNHDDVLELQLDGVLYDETPVEGADCVVIRGKHKPINKADINKDGVVNMLDIVMVAGNWLESSIVED